jgi:hypothetical protein
MYSLFVFAGQGDLMRKSNKNDFQDLIDRQYKATLMLVRLTASLSSDIKDLSQLVQQQNVLLKQIVSSDKMEENPV